MPGAASAAPSLAPRVVSCGEPGPAAAYETLHASEATTSAKASRAISEP